MTEQKIISVNSLKPLGIITIVLLILLASEPRYFCETRPELGLHKCDDFSKYVHEYGKCIKNNAKDKICRSGWVLVENDNEIETTTTTTITTTTIRINNQQHNSNEIMYKCNNKGCVLI